MLLLMMMMKMKKKESVIIYETKKQTLSRTGYTRAVLRHGRAAKVAQQRSMQSMPSLSNTYILSDF